MAQGAAVPPHGADSTSSGELGNAGFFADEVASGSGLVPYILLVGMAAAWATMLESLCVTDRQTSLRVGDPA